MKHARSQLALLGLGGLVAAPRLHAQSADTKFAIGLYTTTLQYRGDLGNNSWNTRNLPFGGGLSLTQYVSAPSGPVAEP